MNSPAGTSPNAHTSHGNASDESKSLVRIGAVFDADSAEGGAIAEICMRMAISDFYALHSTYHTRLVLHTRSSKDLVGTVAQVEDLLKNVGVHTILGPQISEAAPLVIELGAKAHVPVISFFPSSPNLSPMENHYFIRAAQDDSVQAKAIATTLRRFGWDEVVFVYEDSDYGNLFISHLVTALLKNDIRLAYKSAIPTSAEDFQISRELYMLMTRKTRVFIVHMTSNSLGSRLFALAGKAGMMSQGYVWFITTALSNSLNAMDSTEGTVLGIRSHVPYSKDLENFKSRWKRNLNLMKPNSSATKLNIFGLWAYDTIWALARAVERIGVTNSNFLKLNASESTVKDLAGSSRIGPGLLNKILNIKFKGLSGEFHVVNGQLKTSALEIFKLTEKGKRVVEYFWTPGKRSISRRLYSRTMLKNNVVTTQLRIGIPVKTGFRQFVDMETIRHTNKTTYSGFSIEVFLAAYEKLESKNSISFEFIPFKNESSGGMNGNYDDLLSQIKEQRYDAVVGDTTIFSNRTLDVDFTMPYSESGMTMLVPVHGQKLWKMWTFLQPWSWDLWLTVFASFIFMGIVIRIMERRTENTTFAGPRNRQLGMTLWFPFSALAIPQRDMVVKDWSRFVLVIWIGLAVILMQIYTASLSSMLTVDRFQPMFMSVDELLAKGYKVGYQKDSYVKDFLMDQLGFDESQLEEYCTTEDYYKALTKGPNENGGVAAIFDEIPFIRVFLATKYGSKFMMAGTIYRTDGFGFAFPKGSSIVSNFSRAILKVIENGEITTIEKLYFRHGIANQGVASQIPPDNPRILHASSLAGLFIIVGIVTLLALVISEGYFWRKTVGLAQQFISKRSSDVSSNHDQPRNETELMAVQSTAQVNAAPELEVSIPREEDDAEINQVHSS
ncbi:hypothetical protein ACOSP7_012712 [Xanthoceras sorbifolium]